MNETDLMHLIMLELTERGYKVFRTNVGKVRLSGNRWFDTGLPKGHPDLYGYRNDGRIFYVECKVHPNKPTKEQKQFLKIAKENNCLCGVAYSVDDALKIVRGDECYE